ncbi:MAG: hypothetical protein JNG89_20555 [Planctomycetaceae bacterium]|nr:hypothetical protein [Planctomycetaceae bacterium]
MSVINRLTFAAVLVLGAACYGDDPAPAKTEPAAPAVELNEQEQAFVDLMQNSLLVGHFSVDGAEENGAARTDRYRINGVTKVKGDDWLVQARVVYGEYDVVVPVPVKMHWAGDTAVLSVTNLSLPVLGNGFSSRLLFDGKRYAGTWSHNEVGGHMWGKIDKQAEEPESKPEDKK